MRSIHLRNIPDHIYTTLKSLADREHRSLNSQVIKVLEDGVTPFQSSSRSFNRHLSLEELMTLSLVEREQYFAERAPIAEQIYRDNPDLIMEDSEDMLEP